MFRRQQALAVQSDSDDDDDFAPSAPSASIVMAIPFIADVPVRGQPLVAPPPMAPSAPSPAPQQQQPPQEPVVTVPAASGVVGQAVPVPPPTSKFDVFAQQLLYMACRVGTALRSRLMTITGLYYALQLLYMAYRVVGAARGTIQVHAVVIDVVTMVVFRSRRSVVLALAFLALCASPYAPVAVQRVAGSAPLLDQDMFEWVWSNETEALLGRDFPLALRVARSVAFDIEDMFLDDEAPECHHLQERINVDHACAPRRAPCMRFPLKVSGMCIPYGPFTADVCGFSQPQAEHGHSMLAWYLSMMESSSTFSQPPPPTNTAHQLSLTAKVLAYGAGALLVAAKLLTDYSRRYRR